MTIGEKIRRIRKERNLTQKQLGDLCGMADSAIRRYEIGKGNPKFETLERIAKALRVPVSDILPDVIKISFPQATPVLPHTPTEEELSKMTPEQIEYAALLGLSDVLPEVLDTRLLNAYKKLNKLGKVESVRRVEELTEIPKYKKEPPQD